MERGQKYFIVKWIDERGQEQKDEFVFRDVAEKYAETMWNKGFRIYPVIKYEEIS